MTFLMALLTSFAFAQVYVSHSGGAGYVDNRNATPLWFGTNNTEQMRITTSGTVGIGTTTPGVALDVNGIIRSITGGFRFPDGTTMTTAPTVATGLTSTTDVNFAADTDGNGSGAIILRTNGSEKARLLNDGTLGIGTATPVSLLNLSSATGAVLTLSRNDTSALSADRIGMIQFWNNDIDLTTQNIYADIDVVAAQDITTNAAAGVLTFSTTGTTAGSAPQERMRIDSAGNIAIGTATTVGKFIVAPPAAETIVGGATITADACGTIKRITSAGNVTTNTTNTFTAPNENFNGCCMDVINVGANRITLDDNTFFNGNGGNQQLNARETVRICASATYWYQMGPKPNN